MPDSSKNASTKMEEIPLASSGERADGLRFVQSYLEQFGYLSGDYVSDELDASTSMALFSFQHFNDLPMTGEFDEATRDLMGRPTCGMPDITEFKTSACKWGRNDLTFTLDNGTADVAGQDEFAAVRKAFNTWQALGMLKFTEVRIGQNPDIVVDWRPADDPDRNMVGPTVAHADFPPGCSYAAELPLPVHFDDSESTWVVGASDGALDIETVALHEVGHIVGLEHSSVTTAVMYRYVNPNSTLRVLTQDDIDGFEELYIRRVPAVVGLGIRAAGDRVRAADLVPQYRGASGRDLYVVNQNPRPNEKVRPRSRVILELEQGQRLV